MSSLLEIDTFLHFPHVKIYEAVSTTLYIQDTQKTKTTWYICILFN